MAKDHERKKVSLGKAPKAEQPIAIFKTSKGTVVTGKKSKPAPITDREERVAIISTSDRNAFKSCRRKWNWSSPLRQSLSPLEQRHPLWFGSGMHHVLEDFHGHKIYPSTDAAVDDYIQATTKHYGAENLPQSLDEDAVLMKRMLEHYRIGWLKLKGRDPLKTYVVSGEPQVEVPFEFEIPLSKEVLSASGYTRVVYKGVIDRVVIDEDGYLWLQDYKNVARYTNPDHLELDPQIGVYLWAASYIYKRPVIGFVYTQFIKKGVEAPRELKDGTLSVAQDQATSHALYRAALIDKYGEQGPWPEKNVQCLNHLASLEEDEADKFIRRDRVTRPQTMMEAEANKIIAEVSDMLDPALRIYPAPGYMCPVMCSFIEPCLQMDRGENYKSYLQTEYEVKQYTERNDWRRYLKYGRKEEKPIISAKPSGKVQKP